MRTASLFVAVAVLASSSGCGEGSKRTEPGLYQFEEKTVWVRLTPQGRAFQCRVGDGRVYTARGTINPSNQIEWERYWGVEGLAYDGDSIVISGKGTFKLHPAALPVRPSCEAFLFDSGSVPASAPVEASLVGTWYPVDPPADAS